jgi:predicted MFS family arabinose efflux permease
MKFEEDHQPDSLNIEILHKPILAKERHPRYKSVCQQVTMGLIVSMSAVVFGYGLTEISTIPILTLTNEYDIKMKASVAQGLLIGIMPAGGTVGALLNKLVLMHLRRRSSIFMICILMTISMGIIQIPISYCLFIGRFIEGIAIGFYVSIGAIYLR